MMAEIQRGLQESDAKLDFRKDIEPLLGERAGVFVLTLGEEFDGAAIVELSDTSGAQKLIDEHHDSEMSKSTYAGVSYYVNKEGDSAAGIVADHFVGGSDSGFKAVVDASKGDSLAKSKPYTDATAGLSDERLGHFYANVDRMLKAISTDGGLGPQVDAVLKQALDQVGQSDQPGVAVGLEIGASGVAIEATVGKKLLDKYGSSTASGLIDELPAGAWLALAGGGVGEAAQNAFKDGLPKDLGEGGVTVDDVAREFERATGVKLDASLFEPIDEIAIFASGTGLLSLNGGILIKSNDPTKLLADLKAIVTKLGTDLGAKVAPTDAGGFKVSIEGAPVQIAAAAKGDKVAIGLGEAGVKEMLEPSKRLADDPAYKAAKEQLGDGFQPAFFLQEGPILELVDSFGQDLGSEFGEVRTYIEVLKHVVAGTKTDGDNLRFKLAVGLD